MGIFRKVLLSFEEFTSCWSTLYNDHMHRVCSPEDKNLDTLRSTGAMGGRHTGTWNIWKSCWRKFSYFKYFCGLKVLLRRSKRTTFLKMLHCPASQDEPWAMFTWTSTLKCPVKTLPTVCSGRNLADRTANWWTLFTAAATLHRRASWSMECQQL